MEWNFIESTKSKLARKPRQKQLKIILVNYLWKIAASSIGRLENKDMLHFVDFFFIYYRKFSIILVI